jgi:hypothetical protein
MNGHENRSRLLGFSLPEIQHVSLVRAVTDILMGWRQQFRFGLRCRLGESRRRSNENEEDRPRTDCNSPHDMAHFEMADATRPHEGSVRLIARPSSADYTPQHAIWRLRP